MNSNTPLFLAAYLNIEPLNIMLTQIFIRNFVIIKTLELDFQTGMTALTGETGAGKSILLDAIGLVMGDRCGSSVVRQGAKRAEIILTVDVHHNKVAQNWLLEQELDDDEHCILRRVIRKKGQSSAWINSTKVTLSALRELAELLLDIHGQHAHQSLLKPHLQHQMVDLHVTQTDLLTSVEAHWQQWKTAQQRLEHASNHQKERADQLALLHFQVQEFDTLALETDEVPTLYEEHSLLAHAGQLLQGSEAAWNELYAGDDNIYATLGGILQTLTQNARLDSRLESTCELLQAAQINIQEAATELRHHADSVELDPKRLQWVEERISHIETMAQKYRIEPEKLSEKQAQLQAELAHLDDALESLETLQEAVDHALQAYITVAKQLYEKRCLVADELSKRVSSAMQTLGMQGGQFNINVQWEEKPPTRIGMDRVVFHVSANPGQPLKPLHKVASGGELSRINLAIQMIAADKMRLPTLIFDEVDSGIGGGVAEVVGKQLRRLGKEVQVLCVTHLPQVAAQAHQHLRVEKHKHADNTTTQIVILDQAERVAEIARMLGGVEVTPQSLAHAEEMLG